MKPVIVKPASILLGVAAFALFASGSAFAQSTDFGDREPSVDEIVKELQSKPAEGVEGVPTPSLRPGAAVATKAAAPASASISLQVQFGFNSSQIEGGSLQTMQKLAAALASPQLQDRSFTVIGHTDGVGSASYNPRLSPRRARSVRDYLVQHGVDAGRLQTVGKGFSDLLNASDTAAAAIGRAPGRERGWPSG